MKITAQLRKNNYEISLAPYTKEERTMLMRKELLQMINKELLQFYQFFHEEDIGRNCKLYEAQYIVLSLETFREIGKILREHSALNDYWMKQLQWLFTEKPGTKPEIKWKEND